MPISEQWIVSSQEAEAGMFSSMCSLQLTIKGTGHCLVHFQGSVSCNWELGRWNSVAIPAVMLQ